MLTLLKRDLTLAFRTGSSLILGIAFFLIILVIIPLSLEPSKKILITIAPGIFWVGVLLACLLSLDRIFQLDIEDGTLEVLSISPLPIEGTILAKAFAHWLTTCLPLILLVPIASILYGIWIIISLLSGTPALSMIGAFAASLTLGLKRGSLLLSLLVLPLYIPTLIFGTEVIRKSMMDLPVTTPLVFLIAITASSIAILPILTGAAIKINLR
jgi:heme exporter protein B